MFSKEEVKFEVPYYVKVINVEETIRAEKLKKSLLQCVVKASHTLGISVGRVDSDKEGISFTHTDRREQIQQFIDEIEHKKIGNIYFRRGLNTETRINLVYVYNDEIIALVSAFKNPKYRQGRIDISAPGVLYIDALFFRTNQTRLKKAILKQIIIKGKQMNCYMIFFVKTATNLSEFELLKYGFFKTGNQRLVLVPVSETGKRSVENKKLKDVICFLR